MNSPATAADKWMAAALEAHQENQRYGQKAKARRLDAGFYFCKARKALQNGAWGEFVLRYADKISDRTIRRYCEDTLSAMAQAQRENPTVTNGDKLLEIAKTLTLDSPKTYIALARDLGQFRMFGEYDEVRYAASKRKIGEPQLVLNFHYEEVLENLSLIDTAPNFKDLSDNALNTLAEKCDTTAEYCRALLAKKHQQRSKTLQLLDA